MKIKEIVVVEGKDDTVAVQRSVSADTIETNGSAINDEIIDRIRHAQDTRGVIVFTDPDFPGEKIRNEIREKVPGVKHAFLPRKDAKSKRGKIGIEHASVQAIREALAFVYQEGDAYDAEITKEDLIQTRLIVGDKASIRRERLGEKLRIGKTNGKQLLKRLTMFRISKATFYAAIEELDREGQS